jgi:hypothetical protein
MDLAETTNVESSLATGRLQGRLSLNIEKWGSRRATNVPSCVPSSQFLALRLVKDKVKMFDFCSRRLAGRTKGLSNFIRRCLSAYHTRVRYHAQNHTSIRRAPSITTSMLLTRPQTTSRVWTTTILDSSPVSRSSRWRTDSISLSPSSFFAYFSAILKP